MTKTFSKAFSLALILALVLSAMPMRNAQAAGVISLTTLGSAYTQNFDTLSNVAGSTTNTLAINGWYLNEAGGGSRDNEQYAVDNGGSNTGDTYSYGATGSTERALGALRSGTLIPFLGASFTNNTGSTITSLDIAYIGEEWRLGTTGRTDQINFEYSTNATDLLTGTWTSVTSLNFVTPDTVTTGAKDGNAAGERTALSATISGLSIANGATFWIRWTDTDASGADDGLSVDDFSLTPKGTVVVVNPKINEFVFNHVGTDTNEYAEVVGSTTTDYSAFAIVQIEGDGAGAGVIDSAHTVGTTNANGYWYTGFLNSAFENGTVTLLLVKDFSGSVGVDLDTNNDGILDVTPWSSIVDDIAASDGGAGDQTYSSTILDPAFAGGAFAPGGASRIPDGIDTNSIADWKLNDFDLAGIIGFPGTPIFGEAYNTPGALNSVVLPKLVINEIDYDQPSTDTAEYVEIRNNESAAVSLSGWTLELVNGNAGGAVIYDTIALPNVSLAAGDYYVVCANAATVVNCDLDDAPDTDFIQNGAPDAVGLRFNGVLIDAVSYEGDTVAPYTEGSGSGLVDTASGAQSISRCPDGSDTNVNNVDFTLTGITPGGANDCASLTPQLTITDVSLNEGNSGATSFNFTVNLSVPALSGGVTFNIATADNSATVANNDYIAKSLTGQSISAGGTSYTFSVLVNGDTAPESDETFFVNVTNVTGATIIDAQGLGTIVNDDGLAITFIHDIQGSGSAVTGPGPFSVEAIVVGDYQTQGSGQLRGFFLQEEDADADADPATSEGIFVFCSGCPIAVSVGDKVRVTGSASEFFDMSQLSATTAASVNVLSSGNPLPTPASVTLPVPGVPAGDLVAATAFINAYFEPFEGMLVTFPATLSVSEYFELARYGQVILTEGERPHTFTAVNVPTAAGFINHEIDLASRTIILDDTDNRQNRPVDTPNTAYYHPVPGLSTGNFFRGGDTITDLTGVLHWSFAGQSGTDAWRIRPVTESYSYAFTPVNTRPSVPDVDGDLKVASFNVLNYFLTIDTTSSNNVGSCGPSGTADCRGADSSQELERQRTKMLAALAAIDADIFGFMEMENSTGVEPLADIVAGLPGYNYIDTGVIGGDAIRVGIIYKTSSVIPVGDYAILDSSVDPRFDSTRNRPALAQTFESLTTGGRFTVVVNHLKSKGSGCGAGDDDTTTGQGNCNGTRTLAAQALADWLATDPTSSGDSDVLIIGDLNSYAMEDPIVALQDAGYTDLVATFGGSSAYGYVFDGQLGYLDHALANADLAPEVAGVAEWHINADEIPLFDYNDDVRDAGEASFEEESDVLSLYEPNQFRTSDHDPVIIGLNVCDEIAPTFEEVSVTPNVLWPATHKYVDVTATIVVSDNFDPNPTVELVSVESNEPDNGDDDGDTVNDIVIVDDFHFMLRAERSGIGTGRIYTITYKVTDACGNSAIATVTVTVPLSKGK